jgi:hypothetical protein
VNTGRGLGPDLRVDRFHPAATLSLAVRVAAATTLVLGAGLQAASWLVYAGLDLAATYSLVAAGAGRPDMSLALNTLATPFWIAGVAVYVLLGRIRSPRLAWIGGTLLVVGLTGLATNHGTEIMTYSMVQNAIIDPTQADHATRTLESLPAVVTNIMFLVGVVLGIPLTAAALWRSRAVPRIAAALLVAFLAVDLAGQGTGIGAIGAIAHILALIAASWIAVTVMRTPPLQTRSFANEDNRRMARPLRCRLRLHAWEYRENPETHEHYQVCVRCKAYRDKGGSAFDGRGAWGLGGGGG